MVAVALKGKQRSAAPPEVRRVKAAPWKSAAAVSQSHTTHQHTGWANAAGAAEEGRGAGRLQVRSLVAFVLVVVVVVVVVV